MPASRIFLPTTSPDDWRRLLADPDKHWRTGFSARTLAHVWEDAAGLPAEIEALFNDSPDDKLHNPELLLAIPEHKVALPPKGGRPSQNDVFALVGVGDGLACVTVEGKVSEPFGDTMTAWSGNMTPGKMERLAFLKDMLDITMGIPGAIRYQLLHRTASAILEAHRFRAHYAVMVVHAFGEQPDSVQDYVRFLELFGIDYVPGVLTPLRQLDGITLLSGWAQGDPKYLAY